MRLTDFYMEVSERSGCLFWWKPGDTLTIRAIDKDNGMPVIARLPDIDVESLPCEIITSREADEHDDEDKEENE